MNKTSLVSLSVAVGLVVGLIGGRFLAPMVGGDFAGGIVPSQLFTANTTTNSVTPILANMYATGGVSAGGVGLYNQIAGFVSGSSTITATTTLGPFNAVTSTASSSFSLSANTSNLQIGDPCGGDANTSSIYVDGCDITAVGNGNATGTLYYTNAIGTANSLSPSSVTFRIELNHLPY